MTIPTVQSAPPAPPAALRSVFPALTGLRAVASIAVVGTHAAFWTGRYGSDTLGLLWARLDFGVALFFALSGFLLFRPWVSALIEHDGLPSASRYAWNRALRVLPAYWIVVILALIFLPSVTGNGTGGFVRQMTLTHIYGVNNIRSGLTQTWSLATEVAFYLILPFLGWLIVKVVCRGTWHPRRILVFLGSLCVANFAFFYAVYHVDGTSLSSRMWLPAYLSWFAGGMAMTVIVAASRQRRPWATRVMSYAEESPLAMSVVAIGFLAIASTPIAGVASLYQESTGTAIARNVLYASAAVLLLAPLVAERTNLLQRALSTPFMQWLGKISYELFLVHVMLLELAMNILGYETFTGSILFAFTTTMLLSVPAAWLLYRLLEVPLKRFHR